MYKTTITLQVTIYLTQKKLVPLELMHEEILATIIQNFIIILDVNEPNAMPCMKTSLFPTSLFDIP